MYVNVYTFHRPLYVLGRAKKEQKQDVHVVSLRILCIFKKLLMNKQHSKRFHIVFFILSLFLPSLVSILLYAIRWRWGIHIVTLSNVERCTTNVNSFGEFSQSLYVVWNGVRNAIIAPFCFRLSDTANIICAFAYNIVYILLLHKVKNWIKKLHVN